MSVCELLTLCMRAERHLTVTLMVIDNRTVPDALAPQPTAEVWAAASA